MILLPVVAACAGLLCSDIAKLWEVAGRRYDAKPAEAQSVTQGRRIWDEMPQRPGEVAVFEGKASTRPALLGLERFQKAFFLHPKSMQVCGRVLVRPQPLGSWLYPLYFRMLGRSAEMPDTGELSEVQLEYAAPQELALSKEQLPDSGWPQPSWPRWPFNGGLVDHCRLVAPGVIVGKGWKGSGRGRHGQEFLKFMMVKRPAQTQPQSDKSALE
eukprot:jgi/Astpho2/3489/fgenesh1_pg.00056_%23_9_t